MNKLFLSCLLLLFITLLEQPASAQTSGPVISGSATRPMPAILPLDYYASLCEAWLDALENASAFLPVSAIKEIGKLGADRQKAKIAVCAILFPVEVATPEYSAGSEIKVFLKYPDNMAKSLNEIFARPAKIFFVMALIGEVRHWLAELKAAWPATLEPGTADFPLLEKLSARLGALWSAFNADSEPALQQSFETFPESSSIATLLGVKKLRKGVWQDALDMAARARENAATQNWETDTETQAGLDAIILNMRGQAHLRAGQSALAEFDFTEALKRLENLNSLVDLRRELLQARATVRKGKREFGEMCEDLALACGLGECHPLLEARLRGMCGGENDVAAGSD